jgi:GT2 family glycosyltransferase
MAKLLFSLVIPTCNRIRDVTKCLNRLAPGSQKFSPEKYEVIVSDDGRGEDSGRMVCQCFPWVTWLQGPRRGPAANRNHGAAVARGEWLVFVDDDCLPEPGLLAGYAQAVADYPGVNVFEGKTVAGRPRSRLDEESPVNVQGGLLWSCNICFNKELYQRLGGFCEKFPYPCLEDMEWRYRLDHAGEKSVFVEGATVVHPWRRFGKTFRTYLKMRAESYGVLVSLWPTHHKRAPERLRFLVRLAMEYFGGLFQFRGRGFFAGTRKFAVEFFLIGIVQPVMGWRMGLKREKQKNPKDNGLLP